MLLRLLLLLRLVVHRRAAKASRLRLHEARLLLVLHAAKAGRLHLHSSVAEPARLHAEASLLRRESGGLRREAGLLRHEARWLRRKAGRLHAHGLRHAAETGRFCSRSPYVRTRKFRRHRGIHSRLIMLMLPIPPKPVAIGMTPSVVAPGKKPVFCGWSCEAWKPVRVGCSGASSPWFAGTGAIGVRGPFGLNPVACGETYDPEAPVG